MQYFYYISTLFNQLFIEKIIKFAVLIRKETTYYR